MTCSSSVNYNFNRLLFTMSIIIFTLLCAINLVDSQRSTESPCPNFFNYQYNVETGEYTGLVQVPSPPLGSTLHLTVKLTLNARLPSVSGDFYNYSPSWIIPKISSDQFSITSDCRVTLVAWNYSIPAKLRSSGSPINCQFVINCSSPCNTPSPSSRTSPTTITSFAVAIQVRKIA